MSKSLKLALAFLALSAAAGGVAQAQERNRPDGNRGGQRFERLDADKSGDVSFDEFAAAMNSRMGLKDADANSDGTLSVEEIASAIEKMRALRQAERILSHLDADGDGKLTTKELESRQRKVYALMDRNDDGKVEKSEMRRGGDKSERSDRHEMRRGEGKRHGDRDRRGDHGGQNR